MCSEASWLSCNDCYFGPSNYLRVIAEAVHFDVVYVSDASKRDMLILELWYEALIWTRHKESCSQVLRWIKGYIKGSKCYNIFV